MVRNSLCFLTLAAAALGSPIQPDHDLDLESRQTASGCYHHAAPNCCLPGVCMCQNGWIYEINRNQMNAGGQGCDPPWGFIATSRKSHPQYCC
ncbi:hypothetical protein A9K55_005458 [Cordyceps militaris]|uniref:Uncharacterized protein n=1 Tax=Cordyceps militaris TaxID=73501 RepID=A0A2H4SBU9_CORMI|nr:hypothetical protein A9K55_005458 [Cordyceps militaris]